MTGKIKRFLTNVRGGMSKSSSDFSDFFNKPSSDKAEVIRQVLREANEEQRKIVREYRAG